MSFELTFASFSLLLSSFVAGEMIDCVGHTPDLYAIGFQEFDLSRESYVANDEEKVRSWDQAILNTLQKVGTYVQV